MSYCCASAKFIRKARPSKLSLLSDSLKKFSSYAASTLAEVDDWILLRNMLASGRFFMWAA